MSKAVYVAGMSLTLLRELGVFSENEVDQITNLNDDELSEIFNEKLNQIKSGEYVLVKKPNDN